MATPRVSSRQKSVSWSTLTFLAFRHALHALVEAVIPLSPQNQHIHRPVTDS